MSEQLLYKLYQIQLQLTNCREDGEGIHQRRGERPNGDIRRGAGVAVSDVFHDITLKLLNQHPEKLK